jgi:hypothetical protein
MKAKKIITIGVTTIVTLAIVFNRFTRLLKGEQIIYFLARIGGLKDVSVMSLLNIAFVVLFSFFTRVRFKIYIGSGRSSNSNIENRTISLNSSHVTTVDPNQKNHRQAA